MHTAVARVRSNVVMRHRRRGIHAAVVGTGLLLPGKETSFRLFGSVGMLRRSRSRRFDPCAGIARK
jgi:hypothetical protein